MKIVELLDCAIKTGDMLYINGWALAMRYSTEDNCFVWCNHQTGECDKSGYNKVILSGKIMKEDGWCLIPYPKTTKTEVKIVDLCGSEWEKIGQYCDKKYWVGNDQTSPECRLLLSELTEKECIVFESGSINITNHLKVVGFGEVIYRNRITKEEVRVPYNFFT